MNIIKLASLALLSLASIPAFAMEKSQENQLGYRPTAEEHLLNLATTELKLKARLKAQSYVDVLNVTTSDYETWPANHEEKVRCVVNRLKERQMIWKSLGTKNPLDIWLRLGTSDKNEYIKYHVRQIVGNTIDRKELTYQRVSIFEDALAELKKQQAEAQPQAKL